MISVRVPATSANLGPGFDCLGMAVSLYLQVRLELAEQDSFHYQGNGFIANTADNLIHTGFKAAFKQAGEPAPPVRLDVTNPIPLARGLGSSSAALVAGAALADQLLGGTLGQDGVFQLTASIEGHPDNVAPAIYGGFTVSAFQDNQYHCQHLHVPDDWQLLFAVPAFELATSKARSVLPDTYSRADAIHNSSRTALWSLAVALNKPELLQVASKDKLHEPYREPLVPGLAACREGLLAAGASAAFLSGAGPTLGVITTDKALLQSLLPLLENYVAGGQVLQLRASDGYTVSSVMNETSRV